MSRTFRLNKVVRNGIVPDMEAKGQQPEHKTLEGTEKVEGLWTKVLEEAGERDLADLLELVEELALSEGMTFEDLRVVQLAKRAKVGGFSLATYVGDLTLSDDDEWVQYYAAEPERFPEVTKEQ